MTVPKGAPKHIEWGDRMAQELATAGAIVGTLDIQVTNGAKQYLIEVSLGRLRETLADLDKVRDEIVNSENLEKELHDLIYAVYSWSSSQMEPATLISQAQKAHRVLRKIVHVGENSGG